jgi:predicted nucleotide-binding protein
VLSKTASHDQLVQMLRFLSRASTNVQLAPRKVFIVHGRDSTTREMVARYLQRIGLIPVILGEIAAHGSRTSIEKLEANSDVAFAVALLTADEVGGQDDGPPQSRASQNAILELGYFVGRLGRRNVCVLCKDLLDLPSDYQGVIRIRLDATGSWQMQLATELRAAGLPCDLNSLL